MEVKGTLLVDWVRAIKANRNLDYQNYLTEEDWELVNSQVLASRWYPYLQWARIGRAAYRVIARADLGMARLFGAGLMKNLLGVYKNLLVPGDPAAALAQFEAIRRTFFRNAASSLDLVEKAPGRAVLRITVTDLDHQYGEPEAFAHQMAGGLVHLATASGAQNCQAEIKAVREGYDVSVTWD